MKRFWKAGTALLLAGLMAASAIGCAQGGDTSSAANDSSATESTGSDSGEVITIKYPTYRVGTHLSAEAEAELIEGFNKEYEGKIKVEVEEIPGDESYVDKMKVLAASNSLPDVVEGKNGIIDLAIANGQAIDLTAYVEADPDFKAEIGEGALKANTRDGKLYSISNGNQQIAYFYNKTMFEDAGITPAKTWDEFMDNCQKLKDKGYTPVSMMTGENSWLTALLFSAMVGSANDAGNEFMNTRYPETYNTPEVIEALEMIKTILNEYTTSDALGAKYEVAATHFLQGQTAICCNGPWMSADFTGEKAKEGIDKEIGVALYPNNGAFAQYEYGYMVCSADKEHQDAAFEFIKYKTNAAAQKIMLEKSGTVPLTDMVEMSDEFKEANPSVAEVMELSKNAEYKFYSIEQISHASVIDEFGKVLPDLASGDMSAEDVANALDEAAAQSK